MGTAWSGKARFGPARRSPAGVRRSAAGHGKVRRGILEGKGTADPQQQVAVIVDSDTPMAPQAPWVAGSLGLACLGGHRCSRLGLVGVVIRRAV